MPARVYDEKDWDRIRRRFAQSIFAETNLNKLAKDLAKSWYFKEPDETPRKYIRHSWKDLQQLPGLIGKPSRTQRLIAVLEETLSFDDSVAAISDDFQEPAEPAPFVTEPEQPVTEPEQPVAKPEQPVEPEETLPPPTPARAPKQRLRLPPRRRTPQPLLSTPEPLQPSPCPLPTSSPPAQELQPQPEPPAQEPQPQPEPPAQEPLHPSPFTLPPSPSPLPPSPFTLQNSPFPSPTERLLKNFCYAPRARRVHPIDPRTAPLLLAYETVEQPLYERHPRAAKNGFKKALHQQLPC